MDDEVWQIMARYGWESHGWDRLGSYALFRRVLARPICSGMAVMERSDEFWRDQLSFGMARQMRSDAVRQFRSDGLRLVQVRSGPMRQFRRGRSGKAC